MKKILLSTALILFVGSAFALSGTGAFFSDSEVSRGNTFTAGAIDLKIDNESYYNGNACVDVNPDPNIEVYEWTGNASYPVAGTPCTTSWELDELNNGGITLHKFFDFIDLKPGDYSEDTISVHVDTNDSYLCANVTLTSDDDNGINEPEALDGDVTDGAGQGELGYNVNFIWWADDGDNVLEIGENVISQGPIGAIGVGNSYPLALADSDENIWTGSGGPVPGDKTLYIGKAWCFGNIAPLPLPQSSILGGRATTSPAENGDGNAVAGQATDGGYTCNGTLLNNITQTDGLTADISFSAVQARHNPTYQCEEFVELPRTAKLTVIKQVINNNGGQAEADDFSLIVNGVNANPAGQFPGSLAGTVVILDPGAYGVAESLAPGYTPSFSVDCSGNILAGEERICTVTNDDVGTGLTLVKEVVEIPNEGPNEIASAWTLSADGPSVDFSGQGPQVVSPANLPAGIYTLSETGPAGYTASQWVCVGEGVTQNGNEVTLDNGESAICTIVNTEDVVSCNARIDMMIVMDNSGSIDGGEEDTMQAGAVAFVNALTITTPGNHGGLVSFDDSAVLSQPLTDNQATLLGAINAPFGSGSTNLEAGILTGTAELASVRDRTPDADGSFPDVMVIITDGNPNLPTNSATAEAAALAAANAARAAGIEVYVIGVGSDVDAVYLQTIADPGNYYSAAQFSDLELALLTIANCGEVPPGTLTVTKVVNPGADETPAVVGNFPLFVDGFSVVSGVATTTSAGAHVVSETNNDPDYVSVIGGPDCDVNGNVFVPAGGVASCTITNTWQAPQGTLTINKVRVGGFGVQATSTFQFIVNGGAPTNFEADASNSVSVPVGAYTVTEVADADFTTTYSAGCSGTMTVAGATCTITNTANVVTLLSDSFGTGTTDGTFGEAPAWTEDGDTDSEKRAIGTGNDTASPDGGRFAIVADGGTICMAMNSDNLSGQVLKYYWRGDPDAKDGETGFVEYKATSSCGGGGGTWVSIASHELDDGNNAVDEGWSTLQSINLPASLNDDASWNLRFRNSASDDGEFFRVDGVSLTGTAI